MSWLFSAVLNILFPPTCRNCGRHGFWLCAACLSIPKPLVQQSPAPGVNQLLCLGSYDMPVLNRAVQDLKYASGRVLAKPLAEQLFKRFSSPLAESAVLVPVPMHPSRLRSRGFNQAELLATQLSKLSHRPARHLVQRTRNTVPQVTLGERERRRNVQDAFVLVPTLEQMPKSAIIVDDVFTTGATVSEVARVLRFAGMNSITAVTVAKG